MLLSHLSVKAGPCILITLACALLTRDERTCSALLTLVEHVKHASSTLLTLSKRWLKISNNFG